MTKSRKGGGGYNGNCRMIEIGSPGHPFRLVFNVDHIDSIRFEEVREEREFPTPGRPEILDDEGVIVQAEIPAGSQTQNVHAGWTVIITSNGAQSGINFPNIESAMSCYNSVINMIQAVGVPHVFMGPLKPPAPPEKPSGLVDATGKAIEAAVDAADLHPDLAGGEGDGMAENDDNVPLPGSDEDFELSEEDLALLENPQFDESIGEEVEAQAEVEEDVAPPKEN